MHGGQVLVGIKEGVRGLAITLLLWRLHIGVQGRLMRVAANQLLVSLHLKRNLLLVNRMLVLLWRLHMVGDDVRRLSRGIWRLVIDLLRQMIMMTRRRVRQV